MKLKFKHQPFQAEAAAAGLHADFYGGAVAYHERPNRQRVGCYWREHPSLQFRCENRASYREVVGCGACWCCDNQAVAHIVES